MAGPVITWLTGPATEGVKDWWNQWGWAVGLIIGFLLAIVIVYFTRRA
jgi:hypothetical protein